MDSRSRPAGPTPSTRSSITLAGPATSAYKLGLIGKHTLASIESAAAIANLPSPDTRNGHKLMTGKTLPNVGELISELANSSDARQLVAVFEQSDDRPPRELLLQIIDSWSLDEPSSEASKDDHK